MKVRGLPHPIPEHGPGACEARRGICNYMGRLRSGLEAEADRTPCPTGIKRAAVRRTRRLQVGWVRRNVKLNDCKHTKCDDAHEGMLCD